MIKSALIMLGVALIAETLLGINTNKLSIDVTQLAETLQNRSIDTRMDDLVAQSLHDNDRRFSKVG